MPRSSTRIRTLAVGAALASLAAAVASGPAAVAAERCDRVAGRIAAVEDRVEVAAEPDWQPLALGEPVCVGDLLRAGESGQGVLRLDNGQVLRLSRGTTLRLEEFNLDGRTLLRMISGAASFFSRRRQALEVHTPFANAAVEGTEFAVEVGPDRSRVTVLEGQVQVSNPQGTVRLDAGSAAVAVAGRAPEIELQVRPRDAVRWALYYPPLGEARLALDAPAALREAARLQADGRRAEALARLDAAPAPARADPSHATLRAELLLGQGRVDEATAALAEALARDPGHPDALALRSVIAVARNDKDAALADARRAVDRDTGDARARLALSYAAQAAFDIPLARRSLEAAVEAEPDNALAWARLAEARLMQGDVRAATRAADRAASLDPANARAQTVRGFVALARIDTRTAKAAFTRAIELASASPLPHLGLGLATIRDGALEAGREEIELAVTLDPNDPLLRSYLGEAYLEERRDEVAGEELATAKALDPNDPTPWFYDAIRKERENRPVEALRDLREAIERNYNRAVYRSNLLLDRDRARRGTSLARIYNDLGFEHLGLTTATRSLQDDPANPSAHQLRADLLSRQPRREIARVSELLQAQLLEPLATGPIEPNFASASFGRVPGADGLIPQLSDDSPLFQRDQFRATLAGSLGTDGLREEEILGSALEGRTSISVGQYHTRSKGFRPHNEDDQDNASIFLQHMFSPIFSMQAAVDSLDREYDDLAQRLHGSFDPERRARINQRQLRLGTRAEWAPGQIGVASLILADRQTKDRFFRDEPEEEIRENGPQIEFAHFSSHPSVDSIIGFKYYDIDRNVEDEDEQGKTDFDLNSIYSYLHLPLARDLDFTLGLELAHYDDSGTGIDSIDINPKLGVQWHFGDKLTVRAALASGRKPRFVSNQTLEPTAVSGFNQLFDDFNGTRMIMAAAGSEVSVTDWLTMGLEIVRRDLTMPVTTGTRTSFVRKVVNAAEERTTRVFANFIISPKLVGKTEIELSRWETNETVLSRPADLRVVNVPLSLSYFSPTGLFVTGRLGLFDQDDQAVSGLNFSDSELIADFSAGYRYPHARGGLALEFLNVLDNKFGYTDENFRSTNKRRADLLPERTALLRFFFNL